MRFKKLIYIRYAPLTEKVYKDFYMQEVADNGFDMEYWDISLLFFKHNYGQEDSSELTKVKKIDSYFHLEEHLKKIYMMEHVLFISLMTFEGRVLKLHKILKKYNCIISFFGRNMFPLPVKREYFYRIKNFTVRRGINFLQTKLMLMFKVKDLTPYKIIFLAGRFGWKGLGAVDYKMIGGSEIVNINSNDYDEYLLSRGSKRIIQKEYILFLDEYLPLHPDTLLFGIKNVSPEEYYPELNNYFDRVESQFNLPVVIAAHPKGVRYKEEDFFNGREVFFGRTSELSEHAKFVLVHDSTSVNFPICFGKKIHFITSSNIKRKISMVHYNTKNFADYLGCNIGWFDEISQLNLIETVPLDRYEKYKFDFQTSIESQNKLTKDVFIEFLSNVNNSI